MKISIRQGIWETNSSSTHSITVYTNSQKEQWDSGKILYCPDLRKFLPADEARKENIERMSERQVSKISESIQDYLNGTVDLSGLGVSEYRYSSLYLTYEEFWDYLNCTGYEYDHKEHTLEDIAQVVHTVCFYGYNG